MARCALAQPARRGWPRWWLGGESPLHTRQGEVLARGKGVVGDCESEGSPRQNAGLTNRKRIEAAQRGKAAIIVKAQYLHGTL